MFKKMLVAIICVIFLLSIISLSFAQDKGVFQKAVDVIKVKLKDVVKYSSKKFSKLISEERWQNVTEGWDPVPDPPMPPPPPPPKDPGD